MKDKKKSFVIYCDYIKHLNQLDDRQTGQLFKALLNYADSKTLPSFEEGILIMAFSFIKEQMDRDEEKYLKRCEKNAKISRNYWNSVKTESDTISNDIERNRTISDNDTDNYNDYENEYETEHENETDKENVNDTESADFYDLVIDSWIDSFTSNIPLQEQLKNYVRMQKENKNFSIDTFKENLDILENLSSDDYERIEIVKKAMMHNWKSFYPLKRNEKDYSYRAF